MVELKMQRKKKGASQQEIADYLGISRQAYSNYEIGNRQPDLETLLKLAEYYDTSVDLLLRPADSSLPTADELEIMKKIRALDEHGKAMVCFVVEEETRRMQAENEQAPSLEKIIPLFGTSAAAGPGEPDTGMPWEDYTVPEDSRAEFAVRITGDSMEPELHDGQIALCVKRRPQIGELAVIMVNGAMLVKQYIKDFYGNIYLRSLNRARKDCDYNIMATGNDTVKCFGTVIAKRVPLVED